MRGITNYTVVIFNSKIFKIKKKMEILTFVNFHTIMKEYNNFGYAFLIMNTDRAGKKDTY